MSDNEQPPKTVQKYPNGSTVKVDGLEWTVKDMSRDSEALLQGQVDRGEDYNLYRLTRHNTKTILCWQYEIDVETKREGEEPMKEEEYCIKQGGNVLFTGTVNECFHRLLRIQPQSTYYAMKYGGYKIEPAGKEKKEKDQ